MPHTKALKFKPQSRLKPALQHWWQVRKAHVVTITLRVTTFCNTRTRCRYVKQPTNSLSVLLCLCLSVCPPLSLCLCLSVSHNKPSFCPPLSLCLCLSASHLVSLFLSLTAFVLPPPSPAPLSVSLSPPLFVSF